MLHWTILLAFQELRRQWKLGLALAAVFGVAAGTYLTLLGYDQSMKDTFNPIKTTYLVIQEPVAFGEISGSLLPMDTAGRLHSLGVTQLIPEIHAITGTSVKDFRLVHGVDLDYYQEIYPFDLLAGRALRQGDPERTAMIGWRLAAKLNIDVGEPVMLRGRAFNVVGIFKTGSFSDHEAWIPLNSAQKLLGYGEKISIFLTPDDGLLQPGMILGNMLEVVQQGNGVSKALEQYLPILSLMGTVTQSLGAAAAFILTHVLLRLAWLRRHDLAVLRTVGFPSTSLGLYLLTQSLVVLVAGISIGFGVAFAMPWLATIDVAGVAIRPEFTVEALFKSLAWLSAITLAGTLTPAWWLSRTNLSGLLRAE